MPLPILGLSPTDIINQFSKHSQRLLSLTPDDKYFATLFDSQAQHSKNNDKKTDIIHSPVSLLPQQEFDSWLRRQRSLSFRNILDNIAGIGSNVPDGLPGTVIASPSKHYPNYYYQWTRDAAITIKSLVLRLHDLASSGGNSNRNQNNIDHNECDNLINTIDNYINMSRILQHVKNPSGDYDSGLSGLGEPKFMVNGKPFTDHWGRPQRDGPPLRAATIILYIESMVSNGLKTYGDFEDIYWSVIKNDLDYTALYWQEPGFDLWEEINGYHFFTEIANLRALIDGSKIAKIYNDNESSEWYLKESNIIKKFLLKFWDSDTFHLVETLDLKQRNGLDAALFLGVIHSINEIKWDGDELDDTIFKPYSPEVIASLNTFINDMRWRYPINIQRLKSFANNGWVKPNLVGVGIGRYAEDIYNGYGTSIGNPWFLCTSTVAQSVYLIAHHLATRDYDYNLEINELTRPFFGSIIDVIDCNENNCNPDNSIMSIPAHSLLYNDTISGLLAYGDSFLDVLREHHDSYGSMSEQFDRDSGYMKGAADLTWSYGSFWNAVRSRSKLIEAMSY